ncbi:hypothetical protein DEO72_LG7g1584 [Vigna unguiculata]|uniref:Uncharacterized protein n=1 Tax=Vigna unguiculata TaxID=3917 RepID=A0A4D6MHQ1_VIGUN|nr:hypothetical protein DEO72_LG7g1584 [Vigna unguiculata]
MVVENGGAAAAAWSGAEAVDLVRRSWLNARGKKEMASRWWPAMAEARWWCGGRRDCTREEDGVAVRGGRRGDGGGGYHGGWKERRKLGLGFHE